MADINIEVRCQGVFAYLKGFNGERWIAMPKQHHVPVHDEHVCQLHVLKSAVEASDPNFTDKPLIGNVPLVDYVRFNHFVTGLEIVGTTMGPIKVDFSKKIPPDGLPTDPDNDESWTSQGFIASLTEFFPTMLLDITEAGFLMRLPDTTQWHGLGPSDFRVRRCLWQFVDELSELPVLPKTQALTDTVGFFLIVPPTTVLRVATATGLVDVPVNFEEGSKSQVKLIAGPTTSDPLEAGMLLKHFGHLYHLSKQGPAVKVLPKCLGPVVAALPAGDIFCPGGEGEGEGGG